MTSYLTMYSLEIVMGQTAVSRLLKKRPSGTSGPNGKAYYRSWKKMNLKRILA